MSKDNLTSQSITDEMTVIDDNLLGKKKIKNLVISYDNFVLENKKNIFIEGSKGGLIIDSTHLIKFLSYLGYVWSPNLNEESKQKSDDDATFYYNDNNILKKKSTHDIFTDVKNKIYDSIKIKDIDFKDKINTLLINKFKDIFHKNVLRNLDKVEIYNQVTIPYQGKKSSLEFWKNGVLIVNSDTTQLIPWHDLKNNETLKSVFVVGEFRKDIESSTIKNHNIKINPLKIDYSGNILEQFDNKYKDCDVYNFLKMTQTTKEFGKTDKDGNYTIQFKEDFIHLLNIIGYILIGHHNKLNRRIIQFLDGEETQAGSKNGRRGKSLLNNLICKKVYSTKVNCNKKSITSDRFIFSSFREGMRVLSLEEVDGVNNSFDGLYSFTEFIETEQKGVNKYTINDRLTPCIITNANSPMKNSFNGQSSKGRLDIIEFSTYLWDHELKDIFEDELLNWENDKSQWDKYYNLFIDLEQMQMYFKEKDSLHSIKSNEGRYAKMHAMSIHYGDNRNEYLMTYSSCADKLIINNTFAIKFYNATNEVKYEELNGLPKNEVIPKYREIAEKIYATSLGSEWGRDDQLEKENRGSGKRIKCWSRKEIVKE